MAMKKMKREGSVIEVFEGTTYYCCECGRPLDASKLKKGWLYHSRHDCVHDNKMFARPVVVMEEVNQT